MLTATATCEGTTGSVENIIKSPNYPQHYSDNTLCEWSIRSPPNTQISLNLEEFATEKRYDKLEIFDGSKRTAIRTINGDIDQQSINSTGNKLFLKFTSDGSSNQKGFLIRYAIRQGKHKIIYYCYYILSIMREETLYLL